MPPADWTKVFFNLAFNSAIADMDDDERQQLLARRRQPVFRPALLLLPDPLQAHLEAGGMGREAAQQQNKRGPHGQGQDESLLPWSVAVQRGHGGDSNVSSRVPSRGRQHPAHEQQPAQGHPR